MPIQQHPIPQEVAGYKFRLIGDMTVKQFIWLASGILLGIIFYSLPLPFFFKYPLAGIAVAIGAGTAFLPIQGRPMDKWIIAFIKSIYSPTQYVWQKTDVTAVSSGSVPTPAVQPPPRSAVTPSIQITTSPIIVSKVAPPTPPIVSTTPSVPPQPAVTESRLPIPFTPTTPNTLVGMTLNRETKILPGALIEIKSKGNTIRATKSNQLGQFLFAKPLENGLFQIITEKEGYQFEIYSLDLTGQIVKPLKLQAKT